jgi:transglutaminase-like putative cysteine protease
MFYSIRHVTKFLYDAPISEGVMEARVQPRSDGTQRCVQFRLTTSPQSRVMMYMDFDGNAVHHFAVPGRHSRLTVTAEALVECAGSPFPSDELPAGSWDQLDALTASGEYWELLHPSPFAAPTDRLEDFAREIGWSRGADPLSSLRDLMAAIHSRFEYRPQITRVDSPIDEALEARSGVCQDFAHIMIALVRRIGIPCRYVSGYLFHHDRTERAAAGATHAWVEAFVPDAGWIGFDPTNNRLAEERHIRVAIGRDYADVPPTKGVFKGISAVRSELAVAVKVGPVSTSTNEPLPFVPWMSRDAEATTLVAPSASQQQ